MLVLKIRLFYSLFLKVFCSYCTLHLMWLLMRRGVFAERCGTLPLQCVYPPKFFAGITQTRPYYLQNWRLRCKGLIRVRRWMVGFVVETSSQGSAILPFFTAGQIPAGVFMVGKCWLSKRKFYIKMNYLSTLHKYMSLLTEPSNTAVWSLTNGKNKAHKP